MREGAQTKKAAACTKCKAQLVHLTKQQVVLLVRCYNAACCDAGCSHLIH